MNLRQTAFTLVELLVVIAIICVLMGLLLPAVHHAQLHTKVTRARREVKELEEAWKGYCLQYHTFPPVITRMDANAIAILRGVAAGSTNVNPYNFRNVPFMDFRTNTVYYCDPWGTPGTLTGVYKVRLDEDMDNKITLNGEEIGASVLVWSDGPDHNSFTGDDICSWKD